MPTSGYWLSVLTRYEAQRATISDFYQARIAELRSDIIPNLEKQLADAYRLIEEYQAKLDIIKQREMER